jgi:hypothetical protein
MHRAQNGLGRMGGTVGTLLMSLAILAMTLPAGATPYLLVNGQASNNVVRFDLVTGEASLFAEYGDGAAPRNITVREDGAIFGSLFGGSKSVVQLVLQSGSSVLQAVPFSPSIGNFGPGQLGTYQGDVYAAGDRSRVVFQYDGQTGAELDALTVTGGANIRGMVIHGSRLFYAEVFQNTIRKFDLTQDPRVGETFFANSPDVNEPFHLAIGHTGNLFVSSRQSTLIQEFDIDTGEFVRTLTDIATFEPIDTHNYMFEYSAALKSYFVSTARDRVYQLNEAGELVRTLQSDLLDVALGAAIVVPEPGSGLLAWLGVGGIALVVRSRRAGRLRVVPASKPAGCGVG